MKVVDERKREELARRFRQMDNNEMVFRVARGHVQEGASFSAEAINELLSEITLFIGARLINRWERTGEPPTVMDVKVSLTIG